ncbi:hypothetical protein ABK040_011112 [Willaertia magna]
MEKTIKDTANNLYEAAVNTTNSLLQTMHSMDANTDMTGKPPKQEEESTLSQKQQNIGDVELSDNIHTYRAIPQTIQKDQTLKERTSHIKVNSPEYPFSK